MANQPTVQPDLFAAAADADVAAALEQARREARDCRACPLWEGNTQTVFGTGPHDARVMAIGEAPGEQEDLQGLPFVGPAGRLFDEALAEAGLRRERLWVTNTVKHRPWEWQGRRKKNRAPKVSEQRACRPWLDRELALLRPAVIVCLGATAAKAMLGPDFKLTQQRGTWQQSADGPHVLATVHPAYVLIQPQESYAQVRAGLVADLRLVAERCRQLGLDAAAPTI
jgi:uracil-DNA glycosylase family protein